MGTQDTRRAGYIIQSTLPVIKGHAKTNLTVQTMVARAESRGTLTACKGVPHLSNDNTWPLDALVRFSAVVFRNAWSKDSWCLTHAGNVT